MAAPTYNDVTADLPKEHNTSPQHHVTPNSDPALNVSREHHHAHLHHDTYSEQDREDEVVYSKGTTFERSTIPHQDPLDHALHRRSNAAEHDSGRVDVADAEKGTLEPVRSEEDPQTHTFSTFYAKHRIYFHLFIWLLFTGCVNFSLFTI